MDFQIHLLTSALYTHNDPDTNIANNYVILKISIVSIFDYLKLKALEVSVT